MFYTSVPLAKRLDDLNYSTIVYRVTALFQCETSGMKNSSFQNSRGSSSRFVSGLLCAIALCAVAYWYWNSSLRTPPIVALSQAASHCGFRTADSHSSAVAPPDLMNLLERAKDDPRIRDWALLCKGKLLEAKGAREKNTRERAISAYTKVSKNSAAHLDAQLGLLRLQAFDTKGNNGPRIFELEKSIRASHRSDLLPQLLLLQAEEARRAGDFAMAKALYTRVRENYARDDASTRSREALRSLESDGKISVSPADRLHEATLLQKEGDAVAALQMLQKAKEEILENTPSFFELLLTEEKILRSLSRRSEADHLLAFVSADAPNHVADVALMRMAKNAWNTNEHDRALTLLDRFEKQYGRSPHSDEAAYVKARILEEKGLLPDAREVYTRLASRSSDPERVLQALRQIAWIHFRDNSFFQASLSFRSLEKRGIAELNKLEETSTGELTRSKREIRTAINHARYWLAQSLKQTDPGVASSSELSTLNAEEIIASLREDDPLSYYALLDNGNRAVARMLNKREACLPDVPKSLDERLALLSDAELPLLSQFEIDSYFQEDEQQSGSRAWSPASDLVRAKLYQSYASISRSLGLADLVLRKLSARKELASSRCAAIAIRLSFPIPYSDLFSENAEEHNLNPALLLAISHTESHFNPHAKSGKDARGLMQLLPTTAKHEGWDETASLFEPDVNIPLGAKHFSGLVKKYDGNLPYAIAAYNAGSTAVERWRSRYPELSAAAWSELVAYPETKNYIRKVIRAQKVYQMLRQD